MAPASLRCCPTSRLRPGDAASNGASIGPGAVLTRAVTGFTLHGPVGYRDAHLVHRDCREIRSGPNWLCLLTGHRAKYASRCARISRRRFQVPFAHVAQARPLRSRSPRSFRRRNVQAPRGNGGNGENGSTRHLISGLRRVARIPPHGAHRAPRRQPRRTLPVGPTPFVSVAPFLRVMPVPSVPPLPPPERKSAFPRYFIQVPATAHGLLRTPQHARGRLRP